MKDPLGFNKSRKAILQLRKQLVAVRKNQRDKAMNEHKIANFLGGLADGLEKVGKYWIQKAIKNPGALHRQLGVPEDKKIPESKIEAAAEKGGTLGRRARLAKTLKKVRKD